MRIGLDLDGVVYNFDKTAQYMIAKHLGLEKREDLPWDHGQYWRGADKASWNWLWRPENTDALFRHGHLYTGSIEGVRALAELGDVVVVTKRPRHALRVTIDFLRYHFDEPFPFADIRLLHDEPKSSVPCDVYIDDNIPIAKDILTRTRAGMILVNRPWNFPEEGAYGRARRANSWDEIVAHVESLFWYEETRIEVVR